MEVKQIVDPCLRQLEKVRHRKETLDPKYLDLDSPNLS